MTCGNRNFPDEPNILRRVVHSGLGNLVCLGQALGVSIRP